jgi:hypothetical protein
MLGCHDRPAQLARRALSPRRRTVAQASQLLGPRGLERQVLLEHPLRSDLRHVCLDGGFDLLRSVISPMGLSAAKHEAEMADMSDRRL